MATYPEVSVADLEAAHAAWPGDTYDKGKIWAVILRVRIERTAASLSRNVIAAAPDISSIERRLYLSIGEPGLTEEEQAERIGVVVAAVGVYNAICELLHGRNTDPNPPLQEVAAWTAAVDALEAALDQNRLPTPGSLTIAVPAGSPDT